MCLRGPVSPRSAHPETGLAFTATSDLMGAVSLYLLPVLETSTGLISITGTETEPATDICVLLSTLCVALNNYETTHTHTHIILSNQVHCK